MTGGQTLHVEDVLEADRNTGQRQLVEVATGVELARRLTGTLDVNELERADRRVDLRDVSEVVIDDLERRDSPCPDCASDL